MPSRMLMRKNVSKDVSKDSPIFERNGIYRSTVPLYSLAENLLPNSFSTTLSIYEIETRNDHYLLLLDKTQQLVVLLARSD